MAAIAAHLRYISKNGRLPVEDDRGADRDGREAVQDLIDQWRQAGARIPEHSPRREAVNIMLSMPAGTSEIGLYGAARDFARTERLWQRKARDKDRGEAQDRRRDTAHGKNEEAAPKLTRSRRDAARAWCEIAKALASSVDPDDRRLAASIVQYARSLPGVRLSPRSDRRSANCQRWSGAGQSVTTA